MSSTQELVEIRNMYFMDSKQELVEIHFLFHKISLADYIQLI